MISFTSGLQKLRRGTFFAGITLKGFDGLLESLAGAVLLANPAALRNFSLAFWTYGHFHHSRRLGGQIAEHLAATDPVFASLYLLSHGAVKIFLAVALWMNRLWAYPTAILIFGFFVIYQLLRLQRVYSIGLLLLTVSDVVIIWLTALEYRDQKRAQALRVEEGEQR
ncbi:MAG TPA: DUF2127 domain-containing protein [Candidatus Cybelea sp.]|nr:DUF2127 domain-containing protein [Candidatus Cybelea sp.]